MAKHSATATPTATAAQVVPVGEELATATTATVPAAERTAAGMKLMMVSVTEGVAVVAIQAIEAFKALESLKAIQAVVIVVAAETLAEAVMVVAPSLEKQMMHTHDMIPIYR